MQRKSLIAVALAAAFAFPLAANAGNDKTHSASAAGGNDGGAAAMFKSMDKNADGFISKDEAKGSPHDAEFAMLDRNGDGKLSRAEHAAAPDHVKAAKANTGSRPAPAANSAADAAAGKKLY
jgi:hypothetical protein